MTVDQNHLYTRLMEPYFDASLNRITAGLLTLYGSKQHEKLRELARKVSTLDPVDDTKMSNRERFGWAGLASGVSNPGIRVGFRVRGELEAECKRSHVGSTVVISARMQDPDRSKLRAVHCSNHKEIPWDFSMILQARCSAAEHRANSSAS